MSAVLAGLGQQRITGERRRHRHVHDRPPTPAMLEDGDWRRLCRCGHREDPAASRSGRSASRLGRDAERRVERTYGPTKVGERGDAIDLLGRDWKWQSKATRGPLPRWAERLFDGLDLPCQPIAPAGWFVTPMRAMEGLRDDLAPLVIRSWVHDGVPTRDTIVVRAADWEALHGPTLHGPMPLGRLHIVMTGAWFLDHHGRDER